ncbi:bifunctional phosphopantothenoylcysteine decarboxylase/phosphopantothenate--cysteine ligase CoaBC [Phosphitispora fastidiosa]|uniref:bifunctional phosphopantothenoylcysteine decarboxylase/phosphopantothenate--cysteine ligase CoaBC n=1 Tax=Phosphitispora fastidiosa TaxID=2837202 RepID=UPI001E2CF3A8|nr:bifunctional phosphopantothenoylcysteine decarboxylase/phosphopantothenate--cysteine ligase CoaBC [Phosphitispora fastidiosa]MBU7008452.1 phosphopantothenoylcysteine decarboxylase/phosphopantothenate--cysteine ligase [Phosphitispora fastidiosa]
MLTGKCIVIGITGGIAAYKTPDLVSRLVKTGADVHVVMTEAATRFITPLTLQTISRNPVTTGMFETPEKWEVKHISLADRADLLAVVPATANIIGKVSAGIADDILSTVIMATKAPVLFVPAMNVHMYENPVFQSNLKKLASYGCRFLEPDVGGLACGYEGKGRLPGLDIIFEEIAGLVSKSGDFSGKTFLITAGPTREYLDPVRFLSNGSTGKMGYAIAGAARSRGARVILVSGPVNIPAPQGVEHIPVLSARDMFAAVKEHYQEADIIVKAAAVADYSPKESFANKMKKGPGDLEVIFERTPDILHYLGENKGKQVLVGFAAETDNVVENAIKKITAKNLDLIVANDITQRGAGFGTDTNIVKLIYKDGHMEQIDKMAKEEVAHRILDRLIAVF